MKRAQASERYLIVLPGVGEPYIVTRRREDDTPGKDIYWVLHHEAVRLANLGHVVSYEMVFDPTTFSVLRDDDVIGGFVLLSEQDPELYAEVCRAIDAGGQPPVPVSRLFVHYPDVLAHEVLLAEIQAKDAS